ncbi:MAG: iron-sulfur cluster assembly accessory protein [Rickettsiaceae bacterium]|jgi:iron-sulfur cluster assembly accessory protein|nr:iron-sulfur cluster assembly accessory protein [Rickettsiaceae bacterium]
MSENEANITLTENAAKKIADMLSKEPNNTKFRISVDSGGCTGFKYKFDLDLIQNEDDLVIQKGNAIVLIDAVTQSFMKGCVIDHIESLSGSEFEIRNPNATARCGCGNSFSI